MKSYKNTNAWKLAEKTISPSGLAVVTVFSMLGQKTLAKHLFGDYQKDLDQAQREGLIFVTGDQVRITPKALLKLHNILETARAEGSI